MAATSRLSPLDPSAPLSPSADSSDFPSNRLQRSDFELKPFIHRSNWRAAWQITNTVLPYGLLWWAAVISVRQGSWLVIPIMGLMVLFLARVFSLMHDCGHESLFQDRTANRFFGFVLGILAGIPQLPWSRGHAFHHRHNGNWEKYKGPSALVSVQAFNNFSDRKQFFYRILRHPLMLVPGGFFYLVVKPRVELLAGLPGLLLHAAKVVRHSPFGCVGESMNTFKSKWWHSPEEFRDLLLNNIAVVFGWFFLSSLLGPATFWSIYSPVMACGAAIFICIFFVQHNFPGSYAHSTSNWHQMDGVIEGTSDLELPRILDWFSADIGCHAMHHLCEAIPNYNLQACQRQNRHLLTSVKRLHLHDIPTCFEYILWDEEAGRLATIAQAQQG